MARERNALFGAAAVVASTLVALLTPAVSPLYAQTYPGPVEGFEEKFTKAELHAGFETEPVVQYQPVRFSAKLVYGRSLNPGIPTVNITWSNDAILSGAKDEFRITPLTDRRQNLDEAVEEPEGGRALTWAWEVEALVSGRRALTLEIVPFVVIGNELIPDFEHRNRPVQVDVVVHQNKRALDTLAADIRLDAEHPTVGDRLRIDAPDETTAGKATEVSAQIDLGHSAGVVSADIDLTTADGSVARGVPEESSSEDGVVRRTWSVTPTEPGTAALLFDVKLTSKVGERMLEDVVPVSHDMRVNETLWNRFVALVGAIGVVLGAVVTFFVLWDRRRKKNKKAPPAAPPAAEAGGQTT